MMAGEYGGALARKLPDISVLGANDPLRRQEYERAALERHDALFREFGLEPPALDAVDHPAWRDLALALARRHVPAFSRKQGRPATSRDLHVKWFITSFYFENRYGISTRDADKRVAAHFGVDEYIVFGRLKDLRRLAEFKASGPLREVFSEMKRLLGHAGLVDALAEALKPDPEFNQRLADEIERIRAYPY